MDQDVIELTNSDVEAMPEFQEVAEGLSDEERAVLILEFKKQLKEMHEAMANQSASEARGFYKEVALPPHTKLPRFQLDLSFLESKWCEDTKLTIRMGDNPPVVVNSPHRLLATTQNKRGGLQHVDTVELTADRGYLLWTNPRGSIEVKFRYGKSGEDFSCYIDPQHQGVKIYEIRGYRKELVVDGRQPIGKNTNRHHMMNSPVRTGENNFEFRSRDGEVTLQLEVTRDYDIATPKAFKFNYVLVL